MAKSVQKTETKFEKTFYYLLANVVLGSVTNMTVWFAIIFYAYLETEAVLVTAIISGLFLVSTSITGLWFGSLVDNNKKKTMMLFSSFFSLAIYIITFVIYNITDKNEFKDLGSPILWVFIVLLLMGVIAGNLRNIALPTLVTILIAEENRDKANGMVGTATGIAFMIVSVISGILVGHSGMFLVLLLAIIFTTLTIVHLFSLNIPENEIAKSEDDGVTDVVEAMDSKAGIDIKGTIKSIKSVPGLLSLILFTTFNNFLGGVFMSLMDAYGLSLVSVQAWGLIFGFLSIAFIFGGIFIAKKGLGKNPLKSLFMANITIWTVSIFFTIQPSIVLLTIGMFIYLSVIPFIEAAEHTIIQKVVKPKRQGRVFGFAQSIEQAASPLTAFLIGPIAQYIFIPFMKEGGRGAELIGDWFGTGEARGIALVFTTTGILGLAVTLTAMKSRFYSRLSNQYLSS